MAAVKIIMDAARLPGLRHFLFYFPLARHLTDDMDYRIVYGSQCNIRQKYARFDDILRWIQNRDKSFTEIGKIEIP